MLPFGTKVGAIVPTTKSTKNITIPPLTEMSRKNDKLLGTLISSVEWDLLPNFDATQPEINDNIVVGCPIKNDLSSVTAQIYLRNTQGAKEKYKADNIALTIINSTPRKPASTPPATITNGTHQSM